MYQPNSETADSVVYVIGPGRGSVVKIGYSADVSRRLAELGYCSPIPLYVLWTAPGGAALESALHNHFRRQRRHGEWFDLGHDDPAVMVAEVAALMGAPGVLLEAPQRGRRAVSAPRVAVEYADENALRARALEIDSESMATSGRPAGVRPLREGLGVGAAKATEIRDWLAAHREQLDTVTHANGQQV